MEPPRNPGLRIGIIGLLLLVVAVDAVMFTVSFTAVSLLEKIIIFGYGMFTAAVAMLALVFRIRHLI